MQQTSPKAKNKHRLNHLKVGLGEGILPCKEEFTKASTIYTRDPYKCI